MESQPDLKQPWRALLASTGTRFDVASYRPGARIFSQGDDARSVLHVEQGRVWLTLTTAGGKERICGMVEPGGLLGDEALAGQTTRPHSATAMIATTVLVIAKEALVPLLHTHPAITGRFISQEIERSIELQIELAEQLLYSCEERVAHTLLKLAGCDAYRCNSCALPRVSQEVIAEMVGTTRSRVNLFMNRFKKSGMLRKENGVMHVNARLLRRVHHEHHAGM
jgi:CRP-like cAMP-binding protein